MYNFRTEMNVSNFYGEFDLKLDNNNCFWFIHWDKLAEI